MPLPHLPAAVAVDADGDQDDAASVAHLHVGRVDPRIGPVAPDRPVEKGLDPLLDQFGGRYVEPR